MSQVIKKIVESPYAPEDKNVYWNNGSKILKYKNGEWTSATSESYVPVLQLSVSNPHLENVKIIRDAYNKYGRKMVMFEIDGLIGFGILGEDEVLITTVVHGYKILRYQINASGRDFYTDALHVESGIDFRDSELY